MSLSPPGIYLFRLQLRGETLTVHDGRDIRLRPGDFALYDTSRPYKIFFREQSNNLILRVPRERLLQYIARPEAVVSVVMPGDSGLSGLASRHVRELWQKSADFVSHGASPRISEITMQLLASAYSEIPQVRADRSCLAAAHRAQIVELIERRLAEPDLTPSKIAAELRLTPGYLHRLFAGESDTISRYILRRRLEKCATALKDPLQAHRSVTSIAFSHGFNSLPHFSRVFSERYDRSPTDYRQDA
jgi:AraC-like DNA-binding protein